MVPKFVITEDKAYPPYLSNSFKNLIVDMTKDKKMVSNNVVPRDPIYVGFGLGFGNTSELSLDVLDQTKLVIVRETKNKINKSTLRSRTVSTITDFFLPKNNNLGQKIKLTDLTSNLLSLEGVKRIYTQNSDEGLIFEGISFLAFNPLYASSDIQLINQDYELPYFKFPYLYSPLSVGNRIEVIDE